MFSNILSLISLAVSFVALGLSFYFWKNPIDSSLKNRRIIEDEKNNITYVIGTICNKWAVRKNIYENMDIGKPWKFIASEKNNKVVTVAPQTLEELKKLNYGPE